MNLSQLRSQPGNFITAGLSLIRCSLGWLIGLVLPTPRDCWEAGVYIGEASDDGTTGLKNLAGRRRLEPAAPRRTPLVDVTFSVTARDDAHTRLE